jgi:hypothetical protein
METRNPLKYRNILFGLYGVAIIGLIVYSKKQGINENDWFIVFANVLFFMVVQTAFFYFIASKEYEDVIVSKLDIVKRYASKNDTFKTLLNIYKNKYLGDNKQEIDKQTKEREHKNKKLTIEYCGIPILIVTGILLLLLVGTKTKVLSKLHINNQVVNNLLKPTKWNEYDNLGIVLVVMAYVTELLFFFLIVKKYEYVGDNYIYNNIFKSITN